MWTAEAFFPRAASAQTNSGRGKALSSREKFIIMAFILGGFLFVHVRLAGSATNHNYLESFASPRAFSQHSLVLRGLYPGLKPENAFDGNAKTCYREPLTGPQRTARLPKEINQSPVPDYSHPTLSGELGLSHRAAQPPEPEDFSFVKFEFCDSQNSVLPGAVRVQLFRQKLYDVDRQYRVPDPPELWHTADLELGTRTDQRFDLKPEPFPDSSGFPDSFYNVWVRLIFSVPGSQRQEAQELCLQDVRIGNRSFFASSAEDGTCP